jgi:outer membrane protein insertion porin family
MPIRRFITSPPGVPQAALTVLLCLLVGSASSQTLPLHTDANTQVSTIHFRFTRTSTFSDNELRARISTSERGSLPGVRDFFSFLPMVEPVGEHPFEPTELQKDVVRLRSFYRQAGFLSPDISYDLAYDETADLIDITFIIDEGTPILVKAVQVFADSPGVQLSLGPELEEAWRKASADFLPLTDQRLNIFELPKIQARTSLWFTDKGYPFVTTGVEVMVDTLGQAAEIDFLVSTGPRSRIGTITVTGQQSVREGVLLRELPFSDGDFYSSGELLEGRREILGLGLFRRAVIQVPAGTTPSDVIPIQVEVTEAPPRLITGAGGYDSRGGLTLQAEWLHRNFTGDARTFSVSGLAQTGVWAIENIPEILYRATLSLTQPYVFHRRLSLLGGPFVEHRDDYRDRSNAVGFVATLVYQIDPLQSLALRYGISDRRIQEARYGEYTSGSIDFLTLLSNIVKGDRVLKNSMALQISYGTLDDISVPRKGYLVRPTAEITFVPSLNSVQYFRVDMPLYAFQPLSETVGLAGRLLLGTVLPFGKGLPQGDETASEKFLQLRDVVFTAGGPEDVRGWGSTLLGPKAPDIRVESSAPETTYSVRGYIPVGGLSRMAFSLELRLPVPGLGPAAGLSVYLDGGRVWNAKPEFTSITGWSDEDRFFFGTGLGLLYRLPVGTMRLDTGYKLNPSYQDLREASDVTNAVLAGTPPDQVPAHQSKRFHVHFSISVSF